MQRTTAETSPYAGNVAASTSSEVAAVEEARREAVRVRRFLCMVAFGSLAALDRRPPLSVSRMMEDYVTAAPKTIRKAAEGGSFDPPECLNICVRVKDAQDPFRTTTDHAYADAIFNLHVPCGFCCDLASIPSVFWRWLPRVDSYSRAALFHDHLYRTHRCVDRYQADTLFWSLMTRDGVPWLTRMILFYAVRVFGKKAWARGNTLK